MSENLRHTFDLKDYPLDWHTDPIKSLVQKTFTQDPQITRQDSTFMYVDVSSVSNELFKIVDYSIVKGVDAPSRARKTIETNDVIYATVRPTLKRVAIVPEALDGEICSTGYCVLKANEKIHYTYLYYYLLSDRFTKEMDNLQRGASYPAVRDSDIKDRIILVPPLEEQRKIAYVLSTIQKAIEKQDAIISTTTELKKALMQKLFAEGLNGEPQKETEIGLVPESWEVIELGKLAKIGNGSTPKRDNLSYWENGNIPWLTSRKIHEDIIMEADEFVTDIAVHECHLPLVKSGSLLIAITGQGKTLGNAAVVNYN